MFDNFEVTLIRVEGLGALTNSCCIISVDKELIESISLKDLDANQHTVTIPPKGMVLLSIEDQATLASVRFNISIIKCQGYHWLPLFLDSKDLLLEVPEEVGLPRMLLIFQSRKFLSPVIEITETSELSENVEYIEFTEAPTEDYSKNVELRMKIMELEQNLQFEKMNQIQIVEKINREYKGSIDKVNFEMEKYKIWSEKYKSKCSELTLEVEEKKKKILDANDEIEMVKAELEMYKTKCTELLNHQESLYETIRVKDQEMNECKNLMRKSEWSLQVVSQSSFGVNLKPISAVQTSTKHPKLIDFSIEPKPIEIKTFETIDTSDSLDAHLFESLCKLKLEGLFTKCSEQYYKVGLKRVAVVLKNGSVYCKIGDTYKTIENFIYSNCSKELEAFIKKRANSKPSHRRFNTFSSSFDNAVQAVKHLTIESDSKKILRMKNKSITPALVRNHREKSK